MELKIHKRGLQVALMVKVGKEQVDKFLVALILV